jgi:hypothetical protein
MYSGCVAHESAVATVSFVRQHMEEVAHFWYVRGRATGSPWLKHEGNWVEVGSDVRSVEREKEKDIVVRRDEGRGC